MGLCSLVPAAGVMDVAGAVRMLPGGERKRYPMTRQDEHFDAMLRHLGAAYYQTIHGEGNAAEVRRALESAEAADGHGGQAEGYATIHRRGRWRVSDVMTTSVVTVTSQTSCKQVAKIMAERRVNAVPVVTNDGHVLGMVSEADVLRKQERAFRRLGTGLPRHSRRERAQAQARNAAGLMTSPAITIHPDAPLGAAARLMNGHRIRRLPVVDPAGKLIGIVSRRDLLSVFLRPDEQIAAEVHAVLTGILLQEPGAVTVTARDGVVILSGTIASKQLIPVAEKLASQVDGVVAVTSRLTTPTDLDTASGQNLTAGC
jgi:CBS domain-containing protein